MTDIMAEEEKPEQETDITEEEATLDHLRRAPARRARREEPVHNGWTNVTNASRTPAADTVTLTVDDQPVAVGAVRVQIDPVEADAPRLADVPGLIVAKTPFDVGSMHGRRVRRGGWQRNNNLPIPEYYGHVPGRADYIVISVGSLIGWFDTETQEWITPASLRNITMQSRTVRRHVALMREGFTMAGQPTRSEQPAQPATMPAGVPLAAHPGYHPEAYVAEIERMIARIDLSGLRDAQAELAAQQTRWAEFMTGVNQAANVVAKAHGWCSSYELRVRPIGLSGRSGY